MPAIFFLRCVVYTLQITYPICKEFDGSKVSSWSFASSDNSPVNNKSISQDSLPHPRRESRQNPFYPLFILNNNAGSAYCALSILVTNCAKI